jgi:hypothetical protein
VVRTERERSMRKFLIFMAGGVFGLLGGFAVGIFVYP